MVNDPFTSLSSMWTETHGDWGIASDQLKVEAMPGGNPSFPVAMLTGSAVVDDGTYQVKIMLDDAGDAAAVMVDERTG